MPEGPSMVILKELVAPLKGKKVTAVDGNTKVELDGIKGQRVIDFKTWGKHFLICFNKKTIRIHFLLFGTYRINETKPSPPRLHLEFEKQQLNFYACSIRIIEEDLTEVYDWSTDVMSDVWNPRKAREKLKEKPEMLACDALLDQSIFAGSGNIIKNEVLFRVRVHPESKLGKLPARKLTELITEVRNYSFEFLKWKKEFTLKKHWQAHTKTICPRCNIPLIKKQSVGKTKRRSFYCRNCQKLYK
jgi:endonuclease VIII